jgi:carboxymethylenebutenolidase
MSESIDLECAQSRISAFVAEPDEAPWGGLVLIQEIFGVNAHIREVARAWSSHGLKVLAPRLFDFVAPGRELDYDDQGVAEGRRLMAEVGFDRSVAACAAAADQLRREGLEVAALGYCIGGSIAFLCCTRLGLPAVSYYGGRTVPFLHERPQAPLLLLFGRTDPLIPPEAVEAHHKALPNARIEEFDAGHGFNCDQRDGFHAESAARALQTSLAFLRSNLE